MKVLVVRFSSIGDIVLTTPVVRALKLQCKATVHYATKQQFRTILEPNPNIDKVHCLAEEIGDLIRELEAEHFDYIIDLHHNLRTRILRSKLGVKSWSFNKLNIEKWLMVNLKINRLPDRHIVDRYMDTLLNLGAKDDGGGLDYFIPSAEEVSIEELPTTHRSGYVAYAIGGQHYTKKLPIARMIALCAKIGQPIVLLGGKEDAVNAMQILKHFETNTGGGTSIYNACGIYSLHQSASLLRKSLKVYTHDTGLMHIAAAFKKEVVVIWGNTIPGFGMYPYRTQFTNLENTHLSCRPCSKIGYEKCPRGHFKCMMENPF